MNLRKHLDARAAETAEPTPAQAEAGNYRKGRVKAHGLDIVIETPRGALRHGVDASGKPWSCRMPAHYGYISRTEGSDGDELDVYLGPHLRSGKIFVMDQLNSRDRSFDEHKIFMGFASRAQIEAIYRKCFSDGKADDRRGPIVEMDAPGFRAWLATDTTRPIKRAAGGRVGYADGGEPSGLSQDEYMALGRRAEENYERSLRGEAPLPEQPPQTGWWDTIKGVGQTVADTAKRFAQYDRQFTEDVFNAPAAIARNPSAAGKTAAALFNPKDPELSLLKSAKEGFYGPIDSLEGRLPMWETDPQTGERRTSAAAVQRAMDTSGLAGGSVFGTGAQQAAAAPARAAVAMSDTSKPGSTVAAATRSKLPMDEASRMARADEQGYGGPWYHGGERMDRFTENGKIDPRRANSGPMPYFTDDPDVASSYAKGKPDTSMPEGNTADYFTVAPKDLGLSGRSPITVEQSWYFLPAETKADILAKAKRVGHEAVDEAEGPFKLHDKPATISDSTYDRYLQQHRGNPLAALRELWVDSGHLFDNPDQLSEIYRLAGYPARISETNAPWTEAKGVLPARLRMTNPLDTGDMGLLSEKILPALEREFARDRSRAAEYGADQWDKRTTTPREWIAKAKEDYANGDNSFVWTQIPDKITAALTRMGYDGILDTGGKMAGAQGGHRVAIPFGPEQVRSQFAKFDPKHLGKSGLLLSDTQKPGQTVAAAGHQRQPFLEAAVRVGDKIYKGKDHLDALSKVPPEQKSAAQLDGGNRGWVSDRGRFLNREKAQQYAVTNDLIKPDAPAWVKSAPEAVAEWIVPRQKPQWLQDAQAKRMERARDQGFNTDETLYHGTSKDADFKKFKDSRHGTWTTREPKEASAYATSNDSMGHTYDGRNFVPTNTASRVIPMHAKPLENPFVVTEYPESLKYATNYKKAQSEWFDQMKRAGHDGVIFPDGVRVDFDNSKLRSRAAQFDPKHAGKSGLLLSENEHGKALGAAMREIGARELPMDDASRLARAKDQGFDTSRTVYHGSPDARGIEEKGFQTLRERMGSNDPGRAFFFADDHRTAKTYADPNRAWDYQGSEPAVISAFLRMSNPKTIDWGGKKWRGTDEHIAKAKAEGHDGVIIKNVIDDYGVDGKKSGTVRVVFNPEQIRSPKAAFDPQHTDKGGLLLSDTQKPGAVIGAAGHSGPFYSAVERAVEGISQPRMTGDAWLGTLKNKPGVKPEEMQYTGLQEFLESKKGQPVTKQEVADHLAANRVKINEVEKGQKVDAEPLNVREMERLEELRGVRMGDREFTPDERSEFRALAIRNNGGEWGSAGPTKYHGYQLPGGENYREMLVTLPAQSSEFRAVRAKNDARIEELREGMRGTSGSDAIRSEIRALQNENDALNAKIKENPGYRSSHWDEPNVLAHMRMNDREIDGKRSLHVEEIQSDWHQQGRDKGYRKSTTPTPDDVDLKFIKGNVPEGHDPSNYPGYWESFDKQGRMIGRHGGRLTQEQAMAEAVGDLKHKGGIGVPDAPFKKSWHEMALKRALYEAAESGYDRLSWTPGEAQAARYDLSKHVDRIGYTKHADGKYTVSAEKGGNPVHGAEIQRGDIPQIEAMFGKEMAKKIEGGEGNVYDRHGGNVTAELTGLDLKVGGEGMKGFYDNIIPKALEKLVKQHGVKVQKGEVANGQTYVDQFGKTKHEPAPVWYIDIPPSLRKQAREEGFSLFEESGHGRAIGAAGHNFADDAYRERAVQNRNKGYATGKSAAGWDRKRPDEAKDSVSRPFQELNAHLSNARSNVADQKMWADNPNLTPDDRAFLDSGVFRSDTSHGKAVSAAGHSKPAFMKDIRRPSEDIHEVVDANFTYGRAGKNETVPIDSLKGGISQAADDAARVDALADKMSREGGYFERIIADQDGNVVEGQHRLDALRKLGVDRVPIQRVHDLAAGVDMPAVEKAVNATGSYHSDHIHGIIKQALESKHEYGSAAKALEETEMPGQWQKPYEAALKAMVLLEDSAHGRALGAAGHQPTIRAYHGSPHDFDRFDASKVGSGEGAQAYGHGLYFAENPAVAEGYKASIARNPEQLTLIAKSHGLTGDAAEMLAHQFSTGFGGKRFNEWLDGLTSAVDDPLLSPRVKAAARQLIEKSVETSDAFAQMKGPGKMYEVEINSPHEKFLDWDKPLSEQSPEIQKILLDIPEVRRQHEHQTGFLGKDKGLTGASAYAAAANWKRGVDLSAPASAEVSRRLREAGITGIRYLDRGSRSDGEGTRNFVVFDGEDVTMKRKYAIGGRVQRFAEGGAPDDFVVPADDFAVPAEPPQISQGHALGEGYLSGASGNFRDEWYGASEASGLPKILGGFRAPVGAVRMLMGDEEAIKRHETARDEKRVIQKAAKEQHPWTYGGGELAGNIAGMALLPEAKALQGAGMGTQMARGAVLGAEAGAISGAGAGENWTDRGVGAGVGAVGGAAGGGLSPWVMGQISERLVRPAVSTIRGIKDPEGEASRRLLSALTADSQMIMSGKANGMTLQQWVAAKQAGEPVTLADLGAGNTQSLLRSSANTSPEGRAMLEKTLNDRFHNQSERVATDVRGLVSGGANAHKTADQLVAEYDVARGPFYKAAFRHPNAQGMWDSDFAQMATAPEVQNAIRMATVNARSEAAKLGLAPPPNPFVVTKDGRMILNQFDPNDPLTMMKPNLQFWDVVKKNLDAGDRNSQNWAKALREKLDTYGTGYDTARGHAAKFFGERDALAAGRSKAAKSMEPNELAKVMRGMNNDERELFREGFASDWADRVIGDIKDTRDLTTAMFNSPNARKRAMVVFGPTGMKKIEARMALETIMDSSRKAMGNSTTARQLIEAGLAGGAIGGYESGWDPKSIVGGAILGGGARMGMGHNLAAPLADSARRTIGRVDAKTARRVAELLTSNNPADLARGMQMATGNNKIAEGLRSIANRLALSGQNQGVSPMAAEAGRMFGSVPARADEEYTQP